MTSLQLHFEALHNILKNTCTAEQLNWLNSAIEIIEHNSEDTELLALHVTRVHRKIGKQVLANESTVIKISQYHLDIKYWDSCDVARVLLLITAILKQPDKFQDIVQAVYSLSDETERTALIKGLVLYSQSSGVNNAVLKNIALDAGRTNNINLFAALANYNPYPAMFYEEHEFNQLVLKALFIGVSIAKLNNLQQRTNTELSRMCEDYIEERLAAKRPLPNDIWLALAPFASPIAEKLLLEYAQGKDANHRYFSIKAIGENQHLYDKYEQTLIQIQKKETDKAIIDILNLLILGKEKS